MKKNISTLIFCLVFLVCYLFPSQEDSKEDFINVGMRGHLENSITESKALVEMFYTVKDGIVYCYSGNSKTTGIFVSKDGWVLTAGHKVDKDFPSAGIIYIKLTRDYDSEIFQSTEIIFPSQNLDLVLFKVDCKPKYYFKKFDKVYFLQENWVFGFRLESGKVPSSCGYVTTSSDKPDLLLTTAPTIFGNSGSPVLNRDGGLLGILVMGYKFGDGLFIPSKTVKEYIKKNLRKKK